MKAKAGGVNAGRDKKSVNAAAAISAIGNASNKGRVSIKAGEVKEADQRGKRTKERTITEIIEKVSTWRKLYNGVLIPNN